MNKERVCDLTCKAAFEADDPVDNVDCYFIWGMHHLGEGLYEVRRVLEGFGGGFPPAGSSGPGGPGGPGPVGPPGGPGSKGPKDSPSNN